MNNVVTLLFYFMMATMSMVSLLASNWLYTWTIMEIMTALLIFTSIQNKSMTSFEAIMKLFLHQSLAAILLLMFFPYLANIDVPLNSSMMVLCLLLYKMGMPPFHFWAIQIIPSLDWPPLLMFFTLMKVPPLILLASLMQISYLSHLVVMITLISMTISVAVAMNSSQFRIVMLASSISSTQWVLISMLMSQMLSYMYLLTYFMVTFTIMKIFLKPNQYYLMTNNLSALALLLTLVLLTSASLPPFALFFAKMESIIAILHMFPIYIGYVFILMSSLSTIFYLNLLLNISMQMFKQISVNPIKLSFFTSLTLLPWAPMIL